MRRTEWLLHHLQEFQVEQFVFTSTMLVHAPVEPGHRINEDGPIDPRWPYPLSKTETEALIRTQHGDIPIVLLRVTGRRLYNRCRDAFLSQQIARIHERQFLGHLYPGDIGRGRAFVPLADAGEAVMRLIEQRKELPTDQPLLVGEPETLG